MHPSPFRRILREWSSYLAVLLGMVWLAVFPLWQDGSFARITRAKWMGMQTLAYVTFAATALALIILLVRRLTARSSSAPLPRLLRLHPLQAVALAYLGWIALAAWQGALASQLNSRGELAVWMGSVRYEGLMTQLFYIGIFLCMSLLRPRLSPMLHAATLAMLAFFVVVLMQYAGYNPLGLFPQGLSVRTNYEFQGTIGNIDMISGYLVLVTPLLLGGFILLEKPRPLLLLGLCGVMMELMMEVQSGLIALLGGIGLMGLVFLRRPRLRARILVVLGGILLCVSIRMLLALPWLDGTADIVFPRELSPLRLAPALAGLVCWAAAFVMQRHPGKALSLKATLCLAAAVILLALAVFYVLPLPESDSGLWEIQEMLHGRPQDHFGSYRIGVWRYTLDFAKDNLLFGTGPDTFLYAMRQYLTDNNLTLPENFDNPHSEYISILSNNGLPALLIYLTLMGGLLICSLRSGSNESLILLSSVALFMLQGVFSFSICLVTPMFWAVCGMACAWCGKEAQTGPVPSTSTTPKG